MKNVMLMLVLAVVTTGCAAQDKITEPKAVVAEDFDVVLHCQAGVCKDVRTGEIYDYSGGTPKDGYYRLQ